MVEFLQSYGIWIFLGFLFLWMMRGHRHGDMGCDMGGHREHHGADQEARAGQESERASLRPDVIDEEALKGVEGVISAAVNFAGEGVLVRYDREVISGASLMKVVADAGIKRFLLMPQYRPLSQIPA